MKRSFAFLAVLLIGAIGLRASADTDPLSYDDPGMHFRPPDGWVRIPVPQDSSSPGLDEKKLLAAYSYKVDKIDSRLISIVAEPFDGGLDAAEAKQEGDARNASDQTLISHKAKVTLANGMPAWYLNITQGSDDPFKAAETDEYVVYDGSRMIVTSYSGRQSSFSDDDVKKALSSLYVVVYPRHRA